MSEVAAPSNLSPSEYRRAVGQAVRRKAEIERLTALVAEQKAALAERDATIAELRPVAERAEELETLYTEAAEAFQELEEAGVLSGEDEKSARIAELTEQLNASPDDKDKRIAELQSEVFKRDRRDEFKSAVGSDLADKVTVETLWKAMGYEPGAEAVEGEPLAEMLKGVRDSAPYLFKPIAADAAGAGGNTPAAPNAGARGTTQPATQAQQRPASPTLPSVPAGGTGAVRGTPETRAVSPTVAQRVADQFAAAGRDPSQPYRL
jgi:hypothetical protein